MSLIAHLNSQIVKVPNLHILVPRNINLSVPQKVTVVSVTVGLALLGIFARYLRRKRRILSASGTKKFLGRRAKGQHSVRSPNGEYRHKSKRFRVTLSDRNLDEVHAKAYDHSEPSQRIPLPPQVPQKHLHDPSILMPNSAEYKSCPKCLHPINPNQISGEVGKGEDYPAPIQYTPKPSTSQNPATGKGSCSLMKEVPEISQGRRSTSPGTRNLHRQASISGASDRLSIASNLTAMTGDAAAQLTPQQLGVMGMEALETAINYWEDALAAYTSRSGTTTLAVTTAEEAEFSNQLHQLLEAAYRLQDESELLFLDQRSVLFRTDSSARLYADNLDSERRTIASISSPDSFVSAQDEIADLREFEEFSDISPDLDSLPLYHSALKQFEDGGIPCRCLRTEMVRCSSDVEYLAKLHCVRLGFQYLFKEDTTWLWFADTGRQILTALMFYADKDPKDFLIAYEDMLEFLQDTMHWSDVEQELSVKGVKAMTFFDVVLDYILMDAFEDLETPPSSVTAVVQNRWLSNGFKETALTTAVWSVLKAKRRMLKFPNGFMAHFYSISEQISPMMAWGFLGPDENLRDTCHFFKDQVLGFLQDIFSFSKTRFASVDELAEDIFKHVKIRVDAISSKLSLQE